MRILGKKVAVKVRVLAPVTEGGIYLPPTAQKKQLEADVVYVGDEVENIKEGDHVIVDLYHGVDFVDDLTLFDEEDVIAKVVDGEGEGSKEDEEGSE